MSKTKSKKKSNKGGTQKIWKMRGCKKSRTRTRSRTRRGGCNCGINLKKIFKGGSGCSLCNGIMHGGNSIAVGNIGYPWTGDINSWPGVAGVDGQSNYLAKNNYLVDPQTSMLSERDGQLGPALLTNTPNLRGGKKLRKRGGGLIPQDLVNLGRQVQFNLGSTYNALNGYPLPVNPKPYLDHK